MNVSRLHASAAPQVQRVVKDGEERDADVRYRQTSVHVLYSH